MLKALTLSLLATSLFHSKISLSKDIEILTGNLHPFSWTDDKGSHGLALEVVQKIKEKLKRKIPINYYPWPRSLKRAEKKAKIIFPLARVPYREDKFHWVGPILESPHIVLTTKEDKRNLKSLQDLKDDFVGVLQGAPPDRILTKEGLKGLYRSSSTLSLAKILLHSRITAWYDMEAIMYHTIVSNGLNPKDFYKAYTHINISQNIGFSKDLGTEAKEWQKAFEELKKSGEIDKIVSKYFKKDPWSS